MSSMFRQGIFAMLFLCVGVVSVQGGLEWTTATKSAPWGPRYGMSTAVFDDKLWVMGGMVGDPTIHNRDPWTASNDVWSSTEGSVWRRATASAMWSARYGHRSVTFKNKIWVLGGYGQSGLLHDVWYSSNGVDWRWTTPGAPWSWRQDHSVLVFDDKIWVIGGTEWTGSKERVANDVWYSSDGVDWFQATASAPWVARSAVVFNGKMWVMGNEAGAQPPESRVWYSSDGVEWNQSSQRAPWTLFRSQNSVVFDNKIWVLGMRSDSLRQESWYSPDGVGWAEAESSVVLPGVYRFGSETFQDRMWLIGGAVKDGSMSDMDYAGVLYSEKPRPNAIRSAEWQLYR